MNKFLTLALLAIFAVALVFADSPEGSMEGIIDITSANVDSVLDGTKGTIVEFYAPWCGHCKNLAPEYAKLGQTLSKAKSTVVQAAKVNCDEHRDVCQKYSVSGYPTLKWFPKGSTVPEEYNSGRTVEALVDFINSKESSARLRIFKAPTFVEDLNPSNFDEIVMHKDKDVLVKFYAPWCGHCKKMAPDYEKVAQAFVNEDNVVVAKLDADKHRDVASKFGIQGYPTLKFFPRGADKQPEDYNAGRDVDSMLNYLNQKAGTARSLDGSLNENAGVVTELSDLVTKFVAGTADEKKEIVKQAQEKLSGLVGKAKQNAEHYVRFMTRILEKGAEYVQGEVTRLENILSSGSVAGERADNMKTRLNILKLFK
ncbi:hypothetical protein ABK040_015513 [Willaertia magna]